MIPNVPWWIGSLVANVGIARIEYLNRIAKFDSFEDALTHTWWLILISQYGLFNAWNGAPSFMAAWAVFTAGNFFLRLISARFLVGEPMTIWTYVGALCVFAGGAVVKFWGKP